MNRVREAIRNQFIPDTSEHDLRDGVTWSYVMMASLLLLGWIFMYNFFMSATGPEARCVTEDGTTMEDGEYFVVLTAVPMKHFHGRVHPWLVGRPCATPGGAIWRYDGSDMLLLPGAERGSIVKVGEASQWGQFLAGMTFIIVGILVFILFVKACRVSGLIYGEKDHQPKPD